MSLYQSRFTFLQPPSFSHGIWIEEKLQGTFNYLEAEDESIRVFSKFSEDPDLKAKWMKIFEQAAKFIQLTGYHDVDWRNLLKMENGIGFIDFERMHFSDETKKASCAGYGLLNLMGMCPPESIKTMYSQMTELQKDNADKRPKWLTENSEMPSDHEEKVAFLSKLRKRKIEERALILQKYDATSLEKGSLLPLNTCEEGTIKHQIVTSFNTFLNQTKYGAASDYFIAGRALRMQPFTFREENEFFTGCEYPVSGEDNSSRQAKYQKHRTSWKNPEFVEEKVLALVSALEELKQEGIILHFDFEKTETQVSCSRLTIYA